MGPLTGDIIFQRDCMALQIFARNNIDIYFTKTDVDVYRLITYVQMFHITFALILLICNIETRTWQLYVNLPGSSEQGETERGDKYNDVYVSIALF